MEAKNNWGQGKIKSFNNWGQSKIKPLASDPKQTCRLLPLWMIWMGMSLAAMRCNRAMDNCLGSFLSEFNA
jgi:hypothetical protein